MENILLLIEDEPLLAELVQTIGEDAGYEVLLADEMGGIEKALSQSPSVVLMDLNLPTVDSETIIKKMASENCKAQVIVASGTNSSAIDNALRKAEDAGLNSYMGISKPFDIEKLESVLEGLCIT